MKQINEQIRRLIINYIKSEKDISEIIKDLDLRNLDLTHAIISKFNVSNQDISGCRLVNAKIQNARMIHTKAHNVQFTEADMSHSNCSFIDARDSSFLRTNCAYTKFICADLRDCNLCDFTITLGPSYTRGMKFSTKMIKHLHDDIFNIISDPKEGSRFESEVKTNA